MNQEIIKTKPVREAEKMAQAVLDSRRSGPIGLLLGEPGTGKTECGRHLAEVYKGIRLCACEGESITSLGKRLHKALTGSDIKGSAGDIRSALESHCQGRLLIMDQADKLGWRPLEWLRYLADEAGLGVFLIGTDLLDRTFKDGKTGIYMAQMASRIGAKVIHFKPFKTVEDVAGYMIVPEFGEVDAESAKAFFNASKGYWRDGMALADTCRRIMKNQKLDKLNPAVVKAAAEWLAPART